MPSRCRRGARLRGPAGRGAGRRGGRRLAVRAAHGRWRRRATMTDYSEEQRNELEALESIYPDSFTGEPQRAGRRGGAGGPAGRQPPPAPRLAGPCRASPCL